MRCLLTLCELLAQLLVRVGVVVLDRGLEVVKRGIYFFDRYRTAVRAGELVQQDFDDGDGIERLVELVRARHALGQVADDTHGLGEQERKLRGARAEFGEVEAHGVPFSAPLTGSPSSGRS